MLSAVILTGPNMEYTKTDNLKIVADDLGLAECVNQGIFFALEKKFLNSVCLMANGKAFESAVAGLKKFPGVGVGVHLVLVEEKPLLPKEGIRTLIDKNGDLLKNHRIFFLKYLLGQIKLDEVKKELEAQIQRCFLAGLKPEFLNTHQHLHLLPGILGIIINLAKKYEIGYIRTVYEPGSGEGGIFRKAQLQFLHLLTYFAKNRIRRNGLKTNDYFVGFLNAGRLSQSDIQLTLQLLEKKPSAVVELCCHPGFENNQLLADYGHWRYRWENEIKILQESSFQ